LVGINNSRSNRKDGGWWLLCRPKNDVYELTVPAAVSEDVQHSDRMDNPDFIAWQQQKQRLRIFCANKNNRFFK
jgi:hypothetical protein